MVLIALERVKLEALKVRQVPMENPAAVGNLLEKERVGVVENGQVEFAVGEEGLKLVEQRSMLPESELGAFEEDRDIDVTARMDVPGHGRSELKQQADAVRPRDAVEISRGHCPDYTGDSVVRVVRFFCSVFPASFQLDEKVLAAHLLSEFRPTADAQLYPFLFAGWRRAEQAVYQQDRILS